MNLPELVEEARRVQRQIVALDSQQETARDSLLAESERLEQIITSRMCKGEHIEDQVIEYALRKFARFGLRINDDLVYTPSAFDIVPDIVRLMEVVAHFQGKKILSAYGPDVEESGVIRGECVILPWSEYIHGLYIPVDGHVLVEEGYKEWVLSQKMVPEGHVRIDNDFFNRPLEEMMDTSVTTAEIFSDGAIFRHIYRAMFIGGRPKGDRVLYIGDKYVEQAPAELAKVERIDTSCPGCKPPQRERELDMECPIDGERLLLMRYWLGNSPYITCGGCNIYYTAIGELNDSLHPFPTQDQLRGTAIDHIRRLQDSGWRKSHSYDNGDEEAFDNLLNGLVTQARKRGLDV